MNQPAPKKRRIKSQFVRLPTDRTRKEQQLLLRYKPAEQEFAVIEDLFNAARWGELNALMLRALVAGAPSVLAQHKAEREAASPDYEQLKRAVERELVRHGGTTEPAAPRPAQAQPAAVARVQPGSATPGASGAPVSPAAPRPATAAAGNTNALVAGFPKKQ